MTAITAPEFRPVGPRGRIVNVMKLNLANPWTTLGLPSIVLGIIFFFSLALWWAIFSVIPESARDNTQQGLQWSGAATWIFVYMMVIAIQSVNLTFPFALGYGVTRRDFWLGSSLTFIVLAAIYTTGMTILSIVEESTNGWGFGGRMFTAVFFGENAAQRAFVYFVSFLLFFFFGAAIATVYVRWKATGVSFFFVALGALLVGSVIVLTLTDNWQIVGNFFAGAGLIGTYAWSLVITAISFVVGYLILRKATPKN